MSSYVTGYTLAFGAGFVVEPAFPFPFPFPFLSNEKGTEDNRSVSNDILIPFLDVVHTLYLQSRILANGAAT